MQCQLCTNPATVHLSSLTGLQKKSVHLCEACAKKNSMIATGKSDINIQAIVHFMLGQQLGPEAGELARLTCPHCGIKYMEFRSSGRLGCPNDYEFFRMGLEAILRRVHRSVRHVGKRPPNERINRERFAEIYDLHHRLHEAIDREAYEEAALLRDRIRQKETTG